MMVEVSGLEIGKMGEGNTTLRLLLSNNFLRILS